MIAGGVVRTVLEVAGVKNVLSKSLGSTNKINTAYATVKALEEMVPRKNWITSSLVESRKSKVENQTAISKAKKAKPRSGASAPTTGEAK